MPFRVRHRKGAELVVKKHYSGVQITLHWLISGLIVANYVLSEGMPEIFDGTIEGKPVVGWVAPVHVWIGMAVLGLVLVRLVMRSLQGVPEVPDYSVMHRIGGVVHYVLYALMIAVPALGAITWFWGVDATADWHVYAMNAMMLLALGHAAAAIFHQFVLKDGLLMRMIRTR